MSRTLYQLKKSVREDVKERAKDGHTDRHGDFLREVADGNVPVYYADILACAAEDVSLATEVPECGPAFDGTATPCNIIAANIYEALQAEAQEAWTEIEPLCEAIEEAKEALDEAKDALREAEGENPLQNLEPLRQEVTAAEAVLAEAQQAFEEA